MVQQASSQSQGQPELNEKVEGLHKSYLDTVDQYVKAPSDELKATLEKTKTDYLAAREELAKANPPGSGTKVNSPADDFTYKNLKLKDGIPLPPTHLDTLREFGKSGKLKEEDLQKIYDRDAGIAESVVAHQQAEDQKVRTSWKANLEKDWGTDFPGNTAKVAKILQVYSKANPDSKLAGEVEKYGYQNNPDLAKFLLWAFAEMGMQEDTIRQPEGGGGGGNEQNEFIELDKQFDGRDK